MIEVYLIYHTESGRAYVGQTAQGLVRRWRAHRKKNSGCKFLRNVIQKYGRDAFEVTTLLNCDSREEANNYERLFIRLYRATETEHGFNLLPGGVVDRTGLLKAHCVRGHDLQSANSRNKKGDCRLCHNEDAAAAYYDGGLELRVRKAARQRELLKDPVRLARKRASQRAFVARKKATAA